MSNSSSSNPPDTPKTPAPVLCNCGFFGSPQFNNMCSQCYRQTNKDMTKEAPVVESIAQPTKKEPVQELKASPVKAKSPSISSAEVEAAATTALASTVAAPVEAPKLQVESPSKPSPSKDKCHHPNCRATVRRTHKMITKCQCGAFYCLTHKASTVTHSCEFNRQRGQEILKKNNRDTGINVPTGGRSFTRIN